MERPPFIFGTLTGTFGLVARGHSLTVATADVQSSSWHVLPDADARFALMGLDVTDELMLMRMRAFWREVAFPTPARLDRMSNRDVMAAVVDACTNGRLRVLRERRTIATVPMERNQVADVPWDAPAPEERGTIELERRYHDDDPIHNATFKVRLPDGTVRTGKLDESGRARVENVPLGSAYVQFGPDARDYQLVNNDKNPQYRDQLSEADINALIDARMDEP